MSNSSSNQQSAADAIIGENGMDPFSLLSEAKEHGVESAEFKNACLQIDQLLEHEDRVEFIRAFVKAFDNELYPVPDSLEQLLRLIRDEPLSEISDALDPDELNELLRTPLAIELAHRNTVERKSKSRIVSQPAPVPVPSPTALVPSPDAPPQPPATFPWEAIASLAAFFFVPLIGIRIAIHFFADQSLALDGWHASAAGVVPLSAAVLGSAEAFAWFGSMIRFGWLRQPIVSALAALTGVMLSATVTYGMLDSYAENARIAREEMVQNHNWCTYDSVFYWPTDNEKETNRKAQEPTDEQIESELKQLRKIGFDGLLLHECRDTRIVRIARSVGFQAIVQGIRVGNPKDLNEERTQAEIRRAISLAPMIDAIFLGELRAADVDMRDLKRELARIRKATDKPVTTSFVHDDYIGVRGDQLRELEDFVIQGLARPWEGNSGDPVVAAKKVKEAIELTRNHDKPTLIHTVFYPSAGGKGFSEDDQEIFYKEVLDIPTPRGVALVYFAITDLPWKQKLSEVTDYTPGFEGNGLLKVELSDDGSKVTFIERPAAKLLREHFAELRAETKN